MAEHNDTGKRGEDIASGYLSENGYRILERNWRFRHLEIDIIATKGNDLVEEYHIDAERGYICPYMKVNVSNVFSTECTARGYALADNANIYYPKEYVFSFEHVSAGKMNRVYKLIDKTLKSNKKISAREFSKFS